MIRYSRLLAPALLILFALGGLSLFAQRTDTLAPGVHAIVGARVVVAPGKVLPVATVVVRDGVIAAVGEKVTPPADALLIEGKGMTVYPGFLDALTSRGIDATVRRSSVGDPAEEDLAAGALATTKPDNRKGVTPEFAVRTALKLDPEASDAWRKQGITAALIAPDGGILTGQSALVSMSDRPAREAVLASPVAQHLAFSSPGGNDYPRVLMGLIAHARQTLLDAGHHARRQAAFEKSGRIGKRPPVDPALEALALALYGKMPVVIDAESRDQIHRALDFAAEFKLRPIILGGREAYKTLDRLAAEKVPVLYRLDLTDPNSPQEQARDKNLPPRVKTDRAAQRKREAGVPAALAKKGIPFAFASQGLPADRTADKFRQNLLAVLEAGLSADDALTALTTTPAGLLGADSQLGTIEVGKAGHLLVADGDWNKKTTKIKYVFSDGIRFNTEEPTRLPRAEAGTAEGKGPDSKRPGGKGKKSRDPDAREVVKKDGGDEKKKSDDSPKEKDKTKPEWIITDAQSSEIESDRKPSLRTGGNVLLKGATLLPVVGPALPNTDLLIQKGKIAAIGKDLTAPEGVRVIDLAGMFVMPGIIDTHCHFAVSGGVNEFSLSVVPEVRIRDVIASDDVQIYRALAGGVTTARLLHGSANVVGGQDGVIKLKYGEPASALLISEGPRGVKFALGENVKRTDGRFPNTRMGVEAVLVRAFTEAREYRKAWDAYQKKGDRTLPEPRRDLRLEALADVLSGDIRVHCHCYRADEILMLLRVCESFGVKVRSLQHVLEGYKVAPEIAKHGAFCSPFSDWWAYKWEAADAIPHCAALLHEAGVPVCLKSDSNELMRHMNLEAAKMLKYGGLGEQEALATITLNGAQQLGLDRRTGSIEVGKDADLAVFNGHPLNAYARVELTLVEGEVYFQGKTMKPSPLAVKVPVKATPRKLELPASAERVLLVDGIVHPVTGPVQEKATVEIRKGKIHDVRPTTPEDRAMPERVNVEGLHIYPGMIDAGSILGLIEVESARETRDHAEGGDFQPDLKASTAINPDSELIPVTRANGVLSVVTRPTGGIIAGQGALINLAGWVPAEMAVVDPLGLHVSLPGGVPGIGRGSPFGRAGEGVARKLREAKLRRLEELFSQARVHARARAELATTPPNPRLEALAPYVQGKKPVIVQASRREEIVEAIELADKLKVKLIIAGGLDAWKVSDQLKKRDIPVLVGPTLSLPTDSHDPFDAPYACPAKLHAAGVRFCIRSEGDSNTRNLPYQAAMAVAYGLPLEEGLKAVTLYPAQILGVGDQLGSIEKGKIANLVLATEDMLQPSTTIAGLFIAGKGLQPTSKHTRLYERYRQRLREVKGGAAAETR